MKRFNYNEETKIKTLIKNELTTNQIINILFDKDKSRTKEAYRTKTNRLRRSMSIPIPTVQKVQSKFRFYSPEEISTIKNELNKGNSVKIVGELIAKKYNRKYTGTYLKVKEIKEQLEKTNVPRDIIEDKLDIGVELPAGIVFEGKPKKVILHNGYFKVYI
jgi:hypothetical protein